MEGGLEDCKQILIISRVIITMWYYIWDGFKL